MADKKLMGTIFQIPLILLVLGSFIASIYVVMKNLYPISIATPIILGIIILLYFIGSSLKKRDAF